MPLTPDAVRTICTAIAAQVGQEALIAWCQTTAGFRYYMDSTRFIPIRAYLPTVDDFRRWAFEAFILEVLRCQGFVPEPRPAFTTTAPIP